MSNKRNVVLYLDKELVEKKRAPIFLLDLLHTILHEIVHILFPEYGEEEVNNKVYEWLDEFNWKRALGH
jgi:hypothetical protein